MEKEGDILYYKYTYNDGHRYRETYFVAIDEKSAHLARKFFGGKEGNLERISKEDLPNEYYWSNKRAEEFPDWRERKGAYILIENFEDLQRIHTYFEMNLQTNKEED
jgi:hypothetical protein